MVINNMTKAEKRRQSLDKSWRKQAAEKKRICVWVDPEEHAAIIAAAAAEGLTAAAYIRRRILPAVTPADNTNDNTNDSNNT